MILIEMADGYNIEVNEDFEEFMFRLGSGKKWIVIEDWEISHNPIILNTDLIQYVMKRGD